jgi:hypothetical protein
MGTPTSVAVSQNDIYLGTNTVTRLNPDGTVDTTFAPLFDVDAAVSQLFLQVDGQLIVTGAFQQVNGAPVNNIVRLNGSAPEKMANISTRAMVGTSDAVEIGGFIVTGTEDKDVVIRALGPSLRVNGSPLAGTMADPSLELFDSSGHLLTNNNNWRDSQEAELMATGLGPLDDREAAIAVTLAPGAYTAVLQDAQGGSGIGLVEIYDTSAASASRLQNISTRGLVQNSDQVLIAGLILTGPESASIVARALGPSLAASDIDTPLPDPAIELHDQSGAIVASNDNWRDSQMAELTAAGLAPTNDKEAALIATLPPGAYTAIVRDANEATGIGLVEFYDTR